MEQVGIIISVNDGLAEVEVKRMSACGTSCESCHSSCEQKPEYVRLVNDLNAKVGDYVEIVSDTSFVLKSLALVYGVPLILFLGFVVLSFALLENVTSHAQYISIIIGFLSFVVSFFILRSIDKSKSFNDQIKMTRIL
ncbi:SoxR reducing system RseC family protein [Peptoniphilus sp. KCTC 25270]|uniref:SoxR reducing system RseC family protein n=1 Tax=Peptoniphilus sp. KCTC 25270 TaxID=2897414 RepID=UPI001E4898A2|nr:SoxR reducing system RseC family protein [Peptoniphilus sp. KCTC 25270]MCD1147032.1 SoxR reducing system RseC family protein [Peptoniphilus sp. KCTC 25270]